MNLAEELARKKEQIALQERRLELIAGLPFLHGWKWYPWAREFFESTNKLNFLCAANQISKSSTQIRKCIDWATDRSKWDRLWPARRPIQFWYLYPTTNQANIEVITKWQEFLPRGKFKEDPEYGWEIEKKQGNVYAIHFNSGVHVFFKTYAQDTSALQTGTCDAIFCDEELPVDLYDELIFRISASDGYFHMVFTATLGQEFWRTVIEPGDKEEEKLPEAAKWVVSMYDCQRYEDGTLSHWTDEKIQQVKNRCKSANEILKRVYGKFIMDDGGRTYECFDMKRHLKPEHPLPSNWITYSGIDIGGGGRSHPAAICFVKVSPDFRQGRVILGWRGDDVGDTTAGDVFNKSEELKKTHGLRPAMQCYDWGSKDFRTIADRVGGGYIPAEKAHDIGEQTVNTLFKNDMLFIYETDELRKLAMELVGLRRDQHKSKAKDDFCDALRYAVTRIPWDWSVITGSKGDPVEAPSRQLTPMQQQILERRGGTVDEHARETERVEAEIAEWNALY
jgi:phage terminase large subunit-like protein